MCPIRSAIVVAAFSGLSLSAATPTRNTPTIETQVCAFGLMQGAPDPTIVGPADVTKRVLFIPQPFAPVRTLRIDFADASLSIGGAFRFNSKYLRALVALDVAPTLVQPALAAEGVFGARPT
jgi:hypothetical protein